MRIGRYLLLRRIGRGGMAEVWQARAIDAGAGAAPVVVKRMLPHLADDPTFAAMFGAEARVLRRLAHPNIPALYDAAWDGNERYLVMEHVDGVNLATLGRDERQSGARVAVGLAAYVSLEVLRALAYAHGLCDEREQIAGVIHRDVTPSNVMLGFDGSVKLIDFGIAKLSSERAPDLTLEGEIKGKLAYMAPEQFEPGRTADARVDLYAVGVMLHELLSGRRLFQAFSDHELIGRVRAGDIEPPSRSNPGVSIALDEVCLRALARDPAHRFADAIEMARALASATEGAAWDRAQAGRFLCDRYGSPLTGSVDSWLPTQVGKPRSASSARRWHRRRVARSKATGLAVALAVACIALVCVCLAPRVRPSALMAVRDAPQAPPPSLAIGDDAVERRPRTAPTLAPPSLPLHHRRHRAVARRTRAWEQIAHGDVVDPFR